MSRYVNVATRLWHDEKIRTLSEDARSLFLYLLTSPHGNMCGIFFIPVLYACHDLQWNEQRYRTAMEELENGQVISYDGDIVFIKNFIRYNPIKGPKQAIGAAKRLKEVPTTDLIHEFVKTISKYLTPDTLKVFCKEYGYPIDTLSATLSDTPPIPEAEAEAVTEADTVTEAEAEAEAATSDERLILSCIKGVRGYPYDYAKDLEHIRTLAIDYPQVDILAEVKKWATYKLDKPLQKKSNSRSQLRSWMSKVIEFKGGRVKTHGRDSPTAKDDLAEFIQQ